MTSAVSAPAPQRWLMWSLPATLFLIGFFHRVAPGVLAKDLMQAFEATGTIVGLLSATYFYAYAGLMIPAGVLIDAYGPRRVVASGGAVMGLGALAMGAAPSGAVLFAGRFLVGLGATVTFVGTLKIAATWFPAAQFGTLSAITATVGIAGALVATAPLAGLVDVAGWRGALGIVGAVSVVAAVACFVVVRDRPPGVAATAAPGVGAMLRGAGRVLRNPHTWPPFVTFFCLYSALGNLMLWVVPCLRDVYGLSTTRAAWYAAASQLALLGAAPLTGFVSDRVVRRRKAPYVVLTWGLLVLWCVLTATLGTLPLGAVFALLFAIGVASAAFVLTWPIGREVNPPELAGIAVAVVNLGGFVGAALTQGPLGALLDARWSGVLVDGARRYPVEAYRASFVACAGLVLVAALASLLVRETRGRNVHTEPVRTPTVATT
jgi:MFS family permease